MKNNMIISTKVLEEMLLERKKLVHQIIEERQHMVDDAPRGYIHAKTRKAARQGVQFYLRETRQEKNGRYVKREEETLAAEIIRREYSEKVLSILKKEENLIERYLKMEVNRSLEDAYSELHFGKKQYIYPVALTDEEYVKQWYKQYEPMRFAENSAEFYSDRNERMRSKSEVLIANQLAKRNIPYQYEYPLTFENGRNYRPDFRALNLRTRQTFFWEHMGMMGDEEYVRENIYKLREYERHGIYAGKNLIVTYEMTGVPIGTPDIERVIQNFLC